MYVYNYFEKYLITLSASLRINALDFSASDVSEAEVSILVKGTRMYQVNILSLFQEKMALNANTYEHQMEAVACVLDDAPV